METRANYVLIGAFTLVVSIALLLFGLWAAKYSSERSWQRYMIVFDEAVTGLSVGSPVQYNGISVGSIEKLSLDPQDPASWLFIDDGQAHKDFEAVLHAGRRYGGLGYLTQTLRLIPRPLRDWLYRRLARNRYALFGRADLCALPNPALQRRLLK